MRIEEIGDNAIIDCGDVGFTFEVAENPREFSEYRIKKDSLQWENDNYHIRGFRIHPYGDSNNLPEEIRLVIQNHYAASGQLEKKTQMLWGQGPKLYREVFKDGELVREWLHDKEVWDWINSFDGEQYLMRCATDFHHIKGAFTKFYRARGARIGKNKIGKLEHVSPNDARLASKMAANRKKPTHVVVTDWTFTHLNSLTGFKAYKLFDFNNPFAEKNSIYYSNMYSFATDYYTVPELYGALEWLKRSSAIPLIFKALSKNSMNVKYHIQSPSAFWDKVRERIKDECIQKNKDYKEEYFKAWKRDFLMKTAETLSGDENTGKFWHTEKIIEVDGYNIKEQGWEIKPIDQNIKSFVDAHIEISDKSDRVISSALNVHGALGGSGNGKTDSGSEQLYAFKNYINSGVDIPEMIVCKPMNYAIKHNFPNKDLKIGFYHRPILAESEVTPGKRIKNQEE